MQFLRARIGALLVGSLCWGAGLMAQAQNAPARESLFYSAEWRFIRAGEVELSFTGAAQSDMKLRTVGLVSKLIDVNNVYRAMFDPGFCVVNTSLEAHEGSRQRETKVTYDRQKKRASYLERDTVKNTVVTNKELDIPACVHDVTGGLQQLRHLLPEPGKSIEAPMTDGKKVVSARVDSLGREKITTALGPFNTVKYEAFLFNGVLFRRKGRLFIWLTDDGKRTPVQIRVQLPFYVGTVTLQLEKMERQEQK